MGAVMGAHLEFREVAVDYGGVPAVEGVTLAIEPGRTLALVGPSGSGKSSVAQCPNRLIDLVAGARVRGAVRIDGRDVRDPEVDVIELRRRVGMLFQRPVVFPTTIARNLDLPLREHRLGDAAQRQARAEHALRAVGLWDEVASRLERPAAALSGGQQQRLCLARALLLEPAVLLLDEPCSSLDPLAAAVVEEALQRLRGRVTMLLVTHSLAQAGRLADDVALLWPTERGGRLIELQPAAEFLARPRTPLAKAFVAGAVAG